MLPLVLVGAPKILAIFLILQTASVTLCEVSGLMQGGINLALDAKL